MSDNLVFENNSPIYFVDALPQSHSEVFDIHGNGFENFSKDKVFSNM